MLPALQSWSRLQESIVGILHQLTHLGTTTNTNRGDIKRMPPNCADRVTNIREFGNWLRPVEDCAPSNLRCVLSGKSMCSTSCCSLPIIDLRGKPTADKHRWSGNISTVMWLFSTIQLQIANVIYQQHAPPRPHCDAIPHTAHCLTLFPPNLIWN